jgi:hypothetical protein
MRNMILERLCKVTELLQYFNGSTVITQADQTYTASNIGSGLTAGDIMVISGASNSASNGTFTLKTVASGAIVVDDMDIGANETATITMNQEYQSAWYEVRGFAALTGVVNTSGNAQLYVDLSDNGVDVDYSSAPGTSSGAITGGTAFPFEVTNLMPYARIRIRNNGADQTTMRAYLYGRKIS